MTSLLTIPFSLGKPAGDILSDEMRKYYLATAQIAFAQPSLTAGSTPSATIPLSFDFVWDPVLVFQLLDEKLSEVSDSFVIIDLSRPPEFVLTNHQVFAGILAAITADIKRGKLRRFILLISAMLAGADVVMLALTPFIQKGILGIMANNGDCIGFDNLTDRDALDHRRRLANVSIPQISLLQKKLIRFPGHFTFQQYCTNFYFDGSLCERELVDLIDNHVADHYGSLDNLVVLYDAVISRWCESAVLAFCERRSLSFQNMAISNDHYERLTQILLIVPLLDSGHTVQKLVSKINAIIPTAIIKVLAILSTRGDDPYHGTIAPSSSTGPLPIDYFLKVNRAQYEPPQCPLCRAGIPKSDPRNPDPFIRLSSHSFWSIAADVGFEDERDVPSNRLSVGQVPRMRRLGIQNSAFLAYKLEKLLKATVGLPVEPVVICPMEDGSNAIGECLEAAFDMTVIHVPKSVLNSKDRSTTWKETAGTAAGASLLERWHVQIGTLVNCQKRIREQRPVFGRQRSNVIIMDEFNVSGTTRNKLWEFANHYGLEVLCYVSVMDFSQGTETTDFEGYSRNSLSLYDVALARTELWRAPA